MPGDGERSCGIPCTRSGLARGSGGWECWGAEQGGFQKQGRERRVAGREIAVIRCLFCWETFLCWRNPSYCGGRVEEGEEEGEEEEEEAEVPLL